MELATATVKQGDQQETSGKVAQPDAERPGKPEVKATIRSRPQACKTGLRRSDQRERSRPSETTSNALEVVSEAGAPCKGKVCPEGIRKSRQRFSGYPDDYLAPSLFVKRRCGGRRYALRGSKAPEGRAWGGLRDGLAGLIEARSADTDEGQLPKLSAVLWRLRRAVVRSVVDGRLAGCGQCAGWVAAFSSRGKMGGNG